MQRTVIVILAAAGILFAGCSSRNSIKIGFIGPLSVRNALYGTDCLRGIELAQEEINRNGGALGKKIKIIAYDDESNPAKTVAAYTKLVTKDKVKFIIGSIASSCTKAIAPLANYQQILLLTPGSTEQNITEPDGFVFRACYTDVIQGAAAARFTIEHLGSRKAAVFFNRDSLYSIELKESFIESYTREGGRIVAEENYKTDDVDLVAQITRIRNSSPDIVYLPDYYSMVSFIAKELRSRGVNIPIIGSDGWDGITQRAGSEVLNGFYSTHYAIDSGNSKTNKFVADFREKFDIDFETDKNTPLSLAALGYDSMYLMRDAIEKAGNTEVLAVRDALAGLHGIYLIGRYQFDENHNPLKPVMILELIRDQHDNLITKYRATIAP